MKGSDGKTPLLEGQRAKRGWCFLLVATLALSATSATHASGQRANFNVSITILPDAEVTSLPLPVQRLAAVIPGYENHWAQAKAIIQTDPLHAIRLMRHVHAQVLDLDKANTEAIKTDVFEAGQALFADYRHGGSGVETTSLAVLE